MFGKREALFKQNRAIFRVKKKNNKKKLLIQFPTPIFVLLSGLLPYSFTTDGEATGKIQGFGFAFAKEIYPS